MELVLNTYGTTLNRDNEGLYEQIKSDLAEVQACYENNDGILVVPISTDYLKAMKVIGQTINVDVITKTSNTLFF